MYRRFIKRALDIVISAILLIFLLPVMVVTGIIIKIDSKGPILFIQKRIGCYKKEFNILKFRSMKTETPKEMPTHLLANPEKYVTDFGSFMRNTGLDEIPQLINIFVGQMSFIGPRPALWNQFDLLDLREPLGANDIRPGLSGWAQVNGRDDIPNEKKAGFDGYYVENYNMSLDIKCMYKTMKLVLRYKIFTKATKNKKE